MIADYNFIKYHGSFERHLARHFANSGVPGSIFTARRFSTPRQVVDVAYDSISGLYEGRTMTHIVPFSEIIGLDSLIPLVSVPKGASVKRGTRTKGKDAGRANSYTLNFVYGMERIPTNQMVIIAGPVLGNEEKHAFLTIYPGRYAPDFSDRKFWSQHGLIQPALKKGR